MTRLKYDANVEYEELMIRADEVEAPIEGLPLEDPQPPCALPMLAEAAAQLARSAEEIRRCLETGARERGRLAEGLRNAARAFEEVDEDAGQAISNNNRSVSAATFEPGAERLDALRLEPPPWLPPPSEEWYREVKQAAQEISAPDQGAAFDSFADAWTAHQKNLRDACDRLRPFRIWVGESTNAVEANFDAHKAWLLEMADLCVALAEQARNVASTQRWGLTEHPSLDRMAQLDEIWAKLPSLLMDGETKMAAMRSIEQEYRIMQIKSEKVLKEYAQKAQLPLVPIDPEALKRSPDAHYTPPPIDDDTGLGDGPGLDDGPPGDELLLDEILPDPTGMAGVPPLGMPPIPNDGKLKDALAGAPALPKGSGLKPASSGGGGVGGGLPSMPLQPPGYPGAATGPAASTGLGRGISIPPGYASLGGGGMGGVPMVPPGAQGQNAGKGKRFQSDDDSIYTEKRPWTQAIIGLREP